jgi:hypothetical protein
MPNNAVSNTKPNILFFMVVMFYRYNTDWGDFVSVAAIYPMRCSTKLTIFGYMNSTCHFTYRLLQLPVYLLIFCLLPACQSKKPTEDKAGKPDSVTVKPVVMAKQNDLDTLIATPCALLVYPTEQQIDDMKKSYKDSDDFYTAADDNQFYMGMSIEFLDSVKLKTIARGAKGKVTFKTNTGQTFNTQLAPLQWSIILFDGKSKPQNADITMLQDDYKAYMKK